MIPEPSDRVREDEEGERRRCDWGIGRTRRGEIENIFKRKHFKGLFIGQHKGRRRGVICTLKQKK